VIAEGVETKEQLTMLRSQGCPEVQGFLLGRPMPEADVLEFIRSLNERDGRHLRLAASNPALPKPAETCAA
jgi:sensor c-di-GMP phosphodiesterase-like protein